ncbi:hypothetical protein Q0M94_12470 [Deinococcus radiomollis]|uniref:hypothetical protein n=1 Tax=Deinococcus radiomollis TaxID=468916 RepID=UPI003891F88E
MPTPTSLPRPQATQVVNPVQNAAKPNRNLESKLDRLMFDALTASPVRFGLE